MNKENLFERVEDPYADNLMRYKGTVLRQDPRAYVDDIDNFEIRDDDVWLCGYMRSGTNWAQEMVWRVANDADLKNTEPKTERFPSIDWLVNHDYLDALSVTYEDMLTKLKSMPSPRFLKSHLPFHLLPRQLRNGEKKVNMIHVARNPKDLCVSLFYYFQHFRNFDGTIEELCELFITDKLTYTPYWGNVLSFWQKREDFNILFLKYEEMKQDLPSVIRKTCEFLGKSMTDEQVSALAGHLSFENYSKNPSLAHQKLEEKYAKGLDLKHKYGLVRKGTVGQWKQELTADTARRLDQWTEENLQGSGYKIL